jgi:catalase
VNKDGVGVLVKYHWEPLQGIKNLTQPEAEQIQAKNFNHATEDLFEAIEAGNFPQWELRVQIMEDGEHPELDFDPLDDTKLWPEDQFPHLPVGMMTLNRNPENYFAEVEQVAFGTGVLVDGLDFSDDKMLQGRTFSYSDTQRYRVGTNYLQLPINAPKKHVATNQRDGQMTYHVDTAPNQNPHVNYEPSSLNGLTESPAPAKTTSRVQRATGAPENRPPGRHRLQAGRRALEPARGLGERRPDQQPDRRLERRHPGNSRPHGGAVY